MADYSFEIKRAERILHRLDRVSLSAPHEAWAVIEDLALEFDAPGLRIVVKDELARIVIMAGLTGVRLGPQAAAA